MSINVGLGLLEEGAKFLSALIASKTAPAGQEWLAKNPFILGASRIRDGARSETLHGRACPPPPLDDKNLSHLAAGKGLLYLERGPDGTFRAFIARSIPETPPDRELVSMEVNLEYIWDRVLDAVPPGSEVFVLSPGGDALFRTGTPPPGLVERVMRKRDKKHLGDFEWGNRADPLLVFHAMVFLKPYFHSDPWTVVVTRPRSEAFAAADQFIRILFLVIAVVVLVGRAVRSHPGPQKRRPPRHPAGGDPPHQRGRFRQPHRDRKRGRVRGPRPVVQLHGGPPGQGVPRPGRDGKDRPVDPRGNGPGKDRPGSPGQRGHRHPVRLRRPCRSSKSPGRRARRSPAPAGDLPRTARGPAGP